MSTLTNTTLKKNTKLYIPVVTLSSKDNVKLIKIEGFKISVYWNEYQTKIESRNLAKNNLTRFSLDTYFQGVRFFVLSFNNTTVNSRENPINNTNNKVERNSHTKYFFQE